MTDEFGLAAGNGINDETIIEGTTTLTFADPNPDLQLLQAGRCSSGR